jgi:hypothetical protein
MKGGLVPGVISAGFRHRYYVHYHLLRLIVALRRNVIPSQTATTTAAASGSDASPSLYRVH